jgi:hypothetical protein
MFLFRGIIYDALAADYDGDSKLDLFILYKTDPDQNVYNGGFLWGDRVKLSKYSREFRGEKKLFLD